MVCKCRSQLLADLLMCNQEQQRPQTVKSQMLCLGCEILVVYQLQLKNQQTSILFCVFNCLVGNMFESKYYIKGASIL